MIIASTLFVAFLIFQPIYSANAALVSCGRLQDDPSTPENETKICTVCDTLVLASRVINFMLFTLVPAIAVLFYLIAGFLILLGGANPGWVATGKTMFTNTSWGLIIIFASWMITNSVLKSIAGNYFDKQPDPWYKVVCTNPAQPPPPSTQRYTCGAVGCVANSTGQYTDSTCGGACAPATTPTTTPSGTSTPTPTPASSQTACLFTGINLCNGQALKLSGGKLIPDSGPVCGAAVCNQYLPALQDAATKTGISLNLLKATIYKESACQVNPRYFGSGDSYGLMQMQPGTANTFKSFCGVTENINPAWLTDPANATKHICIAAYFYKALADGGCGNSPRNILAGYSGGTTACQPSRDCASDTSCDGGRVRKWECLYDDPQHNTCNGSNTVIGPASKYNETRFSVINKLYCVDNPGF